MAPPQLVSWPSHLANKAIPVLPSSQVKSPESCIALRKACSSVPVLTWSLHSRGAAWPYQSWGRHKVSGPARLNLAELVSADCGAVLTQHTVGHRVGLRQALRVPHSIPHPYHRYYEMLTVPRTKPDSTEVTRSTDPAGQGCCGHRAALRWGQFASPY